MEFQIHCGFAIKMIIPSGMKIIDKDCFRSGSLQNIEFQNSSKFCLIHKKAFSNLKISQIIFYNQMYKFWEKAVLGNLLLKMLHLKITQNF